MAKMTSDSIGADISKDHLDVHRLSSGAAARFPNSSAGFRALTAWLSSEGVERAVYEPTGPYHAAFERAFAGRLPLVKVNPLQARRFAQARGTRAKTDPVDARALAEMGAALLLQPQAPVSDTLRVLKELQIARPSSCQGPHPPAEPAEILGAATSPPPEQARLKQAECQLAEIDREIHSRIREDRVLARTFAILCSIPGIGAVSAAALLIELPEIGTLNRKQVASLAGLAPMTRQSGNWRGRAFIQGGRKHLRDALYMPALVAMRVNPDLKAKYTRLRAAGKPGKLALTVLMRKLIEMANTLVGADREWQPVPT
jgi:transposase